MMDEIFTEIANVGIKEITLEEDGALKYPIINAENLHAITKFFKP